MSLGRYYSQTFYSLRPATDPSAQAITWTGDPYLNFGTAGIIFGLLLIADWSGCSTVAFRRRMHSMPESWPMSDWQQSDWSETWPTSWLP